MTSVEVNRPPDLPGAAEPRPAEAGTGADPLPRHVAIVMDGNRRWAKLHDLSEAEGHSAGVDAIRPIVEHAADRGIEALSIYAFSRELDAQRRGSRDFSPSWRRQSGARRLTWCARESASRSWAACTSCPRPPGHRLQTPFRPRPAGGA